MLFWAIHCYFGPLHNLEHKMAKSAFGRPKSIKVKKDYPTFSILYENKFLNLFSEPLGLGKWLYLFSLMDDLLGRRGNIREQ